MGILSRLNPAGNARRRATLYTERRSRQMPDAVRAALTSVYWRDADAMERPVALTGIRLSDASRMWRDSGQGSLAERGMKVSMMVAGQRAAPPSRPRISP